MAKLSIQQNSIGKGSSSLSLCLGWDNKDLIVSHVRVLFTIQPYMCVYISFFPEFCLNVGLGRSTMYCLRLGGVGTADQAPLES